MSPNRPAIIAAVASVGLLYNSVISAQENLHQILTDGSKLLSDERVFSHTEPSNFSVSEAGVAVSAWENIANSLRESKAQGFSHHFISLFQTEILGSIETYEWFIRKHGGPLIKVNGVGLNDVPHWQALGSVSLKTSEGVMKISPYGLAVGDRREPGHWYRGHATTTGVGIWESHPGQRYGLKLWLRPGIDWSTLQPLPSEVGEFGEGPVSQFRLDATATALGKKYILPGSVYLTNTRYSSRTRKDGLYRGIIQLGSGSERSFGAIHYLAHDQAQTLKFNHVTLTKVP